MIVYVRIPFKRYGMLPRMKSKKRIVKASIKKHEGKDAGKVSSPVGKWSEAIAHLHSVEPVLAEIIDRIGPCLIKERKDHFKALCQSIVSQQISVAAARTVWGRFELLFVNHHPTPAQVLKLTDEQLKAAGISRQKNGYLKSLAQHFEDGSFPDKKLKSMTDEEIVSALIPVKGIGRWTVEMFLIFVLNRPDVWPVDDLGLRNQVVRRFKLRKMPDARKLRKMAEPWRPYRSVATWYLWQSQKLI